VTKAESTDSPSEAKTDPAEEKAGEVTNSVMTLEMILADPRLARGFRAFREFQLALGSSFLDANKGIENKH
jgi:hypothetical protein